MSTLSRGRRPAGGDTRADILAAARASFAEKGFAGTTIRAVASDAGVDPALVHHYFGTKDDLFVAALDFPLDPRSMMHRIVGEGGVDGLGERLLTVFLDVWEQPENRLPLLAVVRSAVAGEPGRSLLQTMLGRFVFGALGELLDVDQPERRLGLVASQMVGLVFGRYVLEIEPLASMPRAQVVASVGPTIQRYLGEPLPAA